LNFLNVCWIYGYIHEEWRTAIVIPIHEKETEITQINIEVLVYEILDIKSVKKIIAKRLTAIAEVLLLEGQSGVTNGRSCMDCIFSAS
jgi:hypothetical protein